MLRTACFAGSVVLFATCNGLALLDDVSTPPACEQSITSSRWAQLIETATAEEKYTPNLDLTIVTPHKKQELPLSCEAASMTEWYNFLREKEGKFLVSESFIRGKMTTFSAPLKRDVYGKLIW